MKSLLLSGNNFNKIIHKATVKRGECDIEVIGRSSNRQQRHQRGGAKNEKLWAFFAAPLLPVDYFN